MKFQYSVIGDNTQENREWLENLGYKLNYIYNDEGVVETRCDLGIYYIGLFENVKNKDIVDCRGNSPLFKAVSAMREDSDYMQWFTDGKEWFLCKRDEFRGYSEFSNSYPEFWGYNYHKATLTELQERFKEKER